MAFPKQHTSSTHRLRAVAAVAVGLLALGVVTGCSDDDSDAGGAATTTVAASSPSGGGGTANEGTDNEGNADEQKYPDVVEVEASMGGDTWDFDVTMSSPYDSPERYADGWRVTGPDGTVFGEHTLGHDHASEQPFTRTQSGVEVPDEVDEVTVEGRDQANGYGGETQTVDLAAAR